MRPYQATHRPILGITVSVLCLLLLAPLSGRAAEPVDDVRVLIDISGSMKRTDPHNLRQPALRLFTTLLPNGAHAGVWTFGQWVNMLVKSGPVDAQWKEAARKAAGDISSRGLYTNIEEAMRRATWDWKRPAPQFRRSLILLTDGLVDIAKDPAQNTASRERILGELLPRLQAAGVTVHTIALSAESDAPLLQQLAAATGGWSETIESAEGLERLFLRLFEKVAKADTLPLTDNRVTVDTSIREATFLIFRKPGAAETSVTPPGGQRFDRQQLPEGVQWHQEDRYDLITVSDPAPGEWRINAELDPDNRVMVVTDLRLTNTALPSDLSAGRPLLFTTQLEQQGQVITREDFLQFVSFTLRQVAANGEEWQWRLRDDGQQADLVAHDGIYSTRLGDSLIEGEHTFELDVDGTTFKRNSHQQVKVYGQPVDAQLLPLGQDRFALTIVPYQSLVDADSIHVELEHTRPDGRFEQAQVPRISPAEWRLEMDEHTAPGSHEISVTITGKRTDGTDMLVHFGPVAFETGGIPQAQADTPVEAEPEEPQEHTPVEPVAAPPPEQHTAPEPAAETEPSVEETPAPAIGWGLIIGSVVGLTALIALLVVGGIKLWPKIKARLDAKKMAKAGQSAAQKKEEETPAIDEAALAAFTEKEEEAFIPDVDQAIDELLADDEPEPPADAPAHDPDLDLGAVDEEPAEMDEPEAEEMEAFDDTEEAVAMEEEDPAAEVTAEEAQEIAEIPDDLLSLDDEDETTSKKTS